MAYNIKGDLSVLRRVFSRFIRVESLSGNTGNVLAADNNGELVSRNVDFFLTGSTIFNNKVNNSTFITYTANTNTLIGTKLNITDFNSYSANTQNTINNNYSQFTGFTNSFYSYSSNTQNTINNNYKQFTAFTNNFYGYTSATNTLIGTKLDTAIFAYYTANTPVQLGLFSSTTTGSTFRINSNNQATGEYSTVSGGRNNTASGDTSSTISGGGYNTTLASYGYIGGGFNNTIGDSTAQYSTISGGYCNVNNTCSSIIGGGCFNTISAPYGNENTILGGGTNKILGLNSGIYDSTIIGGWTNTLSGSYSLIGGGAYNSITGDCSTILGGTSNTLLANNSFIIGSNITGTLANTTYVESLNVKNYVYDSLGLTGTTGYILTTTPSGVKWLSGTTTVDISGKYDKTGGTISGNVTILGNLIVNGTATTINTQNLLVYDPIIGLALVQSGSTNPTLDSGFIIERGLSGNTGFVWKEANKQFELGYTNNSYNDINVSISQFGNLKVGGLKTNYLYDSLGLTGSTGNLLIPTISGNQWRSVDNVISGSTSITSKLNITDFSSYSANTLNTINNNYSQFTGFTNNFYTYTSTTNTLIGTKLNISDFNTFTGTTLPANYFRQNGNSFGTSATLGTNDTQSLGFKTNNTTRVTIASGGTVGINVTPTTARLEIYQSGGTAMNIAGSAGNLLTITDTNTGSLLQVLNSSGNTVFEVGANNYVGITGTTRFVGNIFDFTNSSGNTGNLLTTRQGGVYWSSFDGLLSGSTIYTAFTNSFYGYTATTQNTINNNYNQFTAFTNSFYSYSANTRNTINNNYSQFTAFTNTFYTYSAQTDSRLLFSSGTIGSTFRINNNNQASGQYSTVSGGQCNTALSNQSSIGGGFCNTASGYRSFIGGGLGNISSENVTVVAGGSFNTASAPYSTISGGYVNTASSCYSTISGGRGNLVNNFDGSINGGIGNYVINNKSSIGGGSINIAGQSSTYSGYWNVTTLNVLGDVSVSFNNNDEVRVFNPNDNLFYITTVSAANYNSGIGCTEITFNNPIGAAGNNITFFNRTTSSANGCYNVIGGGIGNVSYGIYSVVGGGQYNTASGYGSIVSGGILNKSSSPGSVISGGRCNTSSGNYSIIVGGFRNTSSGNYSYIGGGLCNTASGNNTFVFGCGLNGCSNNTTYVQSLKINGGTEALFTTSNTTLSAGLNSLYTIPTVYDGAFIDYVAKCGANYRSGQMMSVWSGGTIVYNETTTVDIGNTNPLYFCMIISGGSPVFVSSATTSGWCVKSIIKAI